MPQGLGTQNKKTVSAVDMYDARDIFRDGILDIYDQEGLMDILKLSNRMEKHTSSNWVFHNFTDEDVNRTVTAQATVLTSGTPSVTVPINVQNYVREGDLITTVSGKQARVFSVTRGTPDSMVIKSVDGGNLTVTAGDVLVVGSRAERENSNAPENLNFTPTKALGKIQAFSETYRITDVEKFDTKEVSVQGSKMIVDYGALKTLQKLLSQVNYQMIAGQMSATSFSDSAPGDVDADGYTYQSTRGLHDYIAFGGGVSDSVASAGTFTKADLDDHVNQIVANRTTATSFLGLRSTKIANIMDSYFKGTSNTGMTSARLQVDGKEINFDVEKVTSGGLTFQYAVLPILNNPRLFNMTGNIFHNTLYHIPLDKVKLVGGGYAGRIRLRYKNTPSEYGNGMIAEAHSGMFGKGGNSLKANMEKRFYTAQGLEILGPQHFSKLQFI
ncbi:hypothetical protein PDL71_15435 [Lacibacter sp. MH-610]|uniref:SU10 major capsid protein n=1 Tax=Lacibacter sp. MH-610 TaxID=3020883 RepID=UPI003892347E